MDKNIIEENKDFNVPDDKSESSVSESSEVGLQSSSDENSDTQSVDDEDELQIEDVIDGYVVDTSKENMEHRIESLKNLSHDLSNREEATSSMNINIRGYNVKINDGYADFASTEGMSEDAAIVHESDIVSSYFLSDAFKERAMKSLGYDNLDAMTPDHRKVYDDMVSRGEELATSLRVAFIEPSMRDSIHSCCVPENGITTVLINPEDKGLGLSILGHEIAHHLYQPDYMNPGILEDEEEYGTDRSPLNTINEGNVKERFARLVYENAFKYMSEYAGEDINKIAKDYVKTKDMLQHDNAGMERAADVHGVRLLMMQEGIWNPFTGEPVTVKQVKEFRKAHPNSRIFEYWSNKEATYYLNNIAMSDKVKPDGVRMGYGDDGQCHLVATVGGATVDKVISQRDYDKLLALEDGKRGILMSRLLGGDGYTFDFSEGVPLGLGELLAKEEVKSSEVRNEEDCSVSLREGKDYLAMSAANFDSVSRDLDEGQQQQRGMSV